MKRILLFFALVSAMYMQAQTVSNVRAMQQDTTLVIVYDLKDAATTELQVSFDGGQTFAPANSVTGDIGQQAAGNNRIVYWNATKDVGYFECDKMVFKVIASGKNLYESTAVAGHKLTYDHYHVYQDGQDITYGYKGFLRNNCPAAYRAYKSKWHGMFWGGLGTTVCMIPFTLGAIFSDSEFGMGACFGMMSGCIVTGITLMSCSTITARRHSVKVYNKSCGLLDATAFDSSRLKDTPIKLSVGTSNQGIGLALQF
jgi:hypothetical protein